MQTGSAWITGANLNISAVCDDSERDTPSVCLRVMDHFLNVCKLLPHPKDSESGRSVLSKDFLLVLSLAGRLH